MKIDELVAGHVYHVSEAMNEGYWVYTGEVREVTKHSYRRGNYKVRMPRFQQIWSRDPGPRELEYTQDGDMPSFQIGDLRGPVYGIRPQGVEYEFAGSIELAVSKFKDAQDVRDRREELTQSFLAQLNGITQVVNADLEPVFGTWTHTNLGTAGVHRYELVLTEVQARQWIQLMRQKAE